MTEPILLFINRSIEYSNFASSLLFDVFYYYNGKFYSYVTKYRISSSSDIYPFNSEELAYVDFSMIYSKLKKDYCLNESKIDSVIREYKLKNLLN